MTYTVINSPGADLDIAAAYLHIRREAPLNAERWLRGMLKAVHSLEKLPRRCAHVPEQEEFAIELRQLLFKSHRIIFTIEGRTVRILHVRHVARHSLGPRDLAEHRDDPRID